MNENEMDEEIVEPIIVRSYSETEKVKSFSFTGEKIARLKKWNEKFNDKRAEKRKVTVLSKTPSILPFVEITDNYILLKSGYMDILQVSPKDLFSLNQDDLNYSLVAEGRFLRSYYPSFKNIAMNFPSNTEKQRAYWQKKKEKTTDPLRLKFIERKLFEFDFLERERTNREFFIFIYAENESQLEERRRQVMRSKQQTFPLTQLSVDKKMDVLFILNNQNSKL